MGELIGSNLYISILRKGIQIFDKSPQLILRESIDAPNADLTLPLNTRSLRR
jgi:hypothetical protein